MALILILFVSAILAVTAYFTARVHFKDNRAAENRDMFTRFNNSVEARIRRSGGRLPVWGYYCILIAVPVALFTLCYYYIGNMVFAVILGALGLLIPEVILAAMRSSQDKNFEKSFLRSLEQLDSSLRSGSSIAQAVDDAAACKFIQGGLKKQYAKLSSDIHMGVSISDAFEDFAEDTGSIDAKDLAVSIEIQQEVGGREADAVKQIANNIKDRIMTRKEVGSIFAGESSMIWIMDFVVPVVILFSVITNRNYISVYFSSPPMILLFISFFVLSLIGTVINHTTLKRLKNR